MKYELMLAQKTDSVPQGDYLFEVKWDGIRAIFERRRGKIRIYARSGREITAQFPELQDMTAIKCNGVFDGEIIVKDKDGKPSSDLVSSRVHLSRGIDRAARLRPATAMLFDFLEIRGKDLRNDPFRDRHNRLIEAIDSSSGHYIVSYIWSNGPALWEAVQKEGLEGIVAKRQMGRYISGESDAWLKLKVRHFMDVFVIGYTKGHGERDATFGALLLEDQMGSEIGKVGSFRGKGEILWTFRRLFDKMGGGIRYPSDPEGHFRLKMKIPIEISYAEQKPGGLREPVFERLRTE